ncbi:MAG: GNAT family N-acetyltransferase [Candidatus Woesearchaeota archaeon]
MLIRTATLGDAEQIRKLILENVVARDSNSPGLVEYETFTIPEIERLIDDNPFFYVVVENQQVIAFLSNYTNERIRQLPKDPMINHLLSLDSKFIYSELAVSREGYRRQGFVKQLFHKLFQDAHSNNFTEIYSCVSHHPLRHQPSINLLTKLGFQFLEEFDMKSGLVFGKYKKEI